jgi:hypothetical protein
VSATESSSKSRFDLYFHAYHQLGPTRSLRRLQRELRSSGIETSIGTLKRLSTRYDWQARIADLDVEARKRLHEQDVAGTMAMHDRHAQLGRAMQGAAGSALQRLLANDARLSGLKPTDIARLIELGLRAERSAVGVATDRRDIAIDVWNDVVIIVARLFLDINDEPDERTRARLFARRLDRIIDERLAQYAKEV